MLETPDNCLHVIPPKHRFKQPLPQEVILGPKNFGGLGKDDIYTVQGV